MSQGGALVVDIGKSATRFRMAGAEGELAGLSPEGADTEHAASMLADRVLGALAAVGPAASVVVGTTFLPSDEACSAAADLIAHRHPGLGIALAEDGVVAHAGVLGGPGVVAAVGTGVIVTGVRDGRLTRVDGWGPDLGDRGSAAEIGRLGLAAAFAALDGASPATSLSRPAEEFFGRPLDVRAAAWLLAQPDRVARMSSFAVEVAAAAAAGDGVSGAILDEAAARLAASCRAVATDGAPIAVIGRMAGLAGYRERLDAALATVGLARFETSRTALDAAWDVVTAEPYASCCSVVRRAA